MKHLIKMEEAGMMGLSVALFSLTDFAWWWYPLLILAPDIGMVGYLAGPGTGAVVYNFFHHKGLAIVLLCTGWLLTAPWVVLTGIILFGHASMDRIFGYGLKYADSFHHTHLGWIGKGPHAPR